MRKTTVSNKVNKVDYFMWTIICSFLLIALVLYIASSAYLNSTNLEVEKLKRKVEEQKNVNSSLSMQVDELASLSNIQEVAKQYGLSYNNDNIIVIK